MKNNRIAKIVSKRFLIKLLSIIVMISMMLDFSVSFSNAVSYYTIRINYVFKDGTPAHDPYVATYPEGASIDLTVTNPAIDGFVPMTSDEGGVSAATTTFQYDSLDSNHTETVYYLAGMTHYRVMYYKQNLYDDLYTRDNTLSNVYTDRYGYTGTNPTDLEDIEFEGFTNLFHEPDAIAADGSTVFRVYYDRNYYSVMFDLGEHGYGTEPVYAKYQSVYHVTEPKRLGYSFVGWLRTDKDSTKGEYGTDWHFIDENGDELTDNSGNPLFDEHGEPVDESLDTSQYYIPFFPQATIPAHNTYYKAVWNRGTTSYSVVYWIQNPDGDDITEEDIAATADINEARALIAQNYTVVAARDITGVTSGTMVNLDTWTTNAHGDPLQLWDFFSYYLSGNGLFQMSDAQRDELYGKSKYYEFNSYLSSLQFNGPHEEYDKTHIEVMGDGTTRLNVYYDRKDFTLKFYYARQKLNNGVANGAIDLTNSTKGFSNYAYYNKTNETYLNAVSQGTWQTDIAESLPQINSDLLVENGGPLTPGYNDYSGYRYYYYQVSARYNEPLTNKWRIDAISSVNKKGNNYAGQICYPGSWAVENGTYFYDSHVSVKNFTVKGVYERLGDELMFKPDTVSDYQELHYLLSWTNTATSSGWNYGMANVLHFTYENYVELLPKEIDAMTDDDDADGILNGPQKLIDEGIYENIYMHSSSSAKTYTLVDPSQSFVYNANAKYYGIKTENRIETTDSGSQYPINDMNKKTSSVRNEQVPTEMKGFTIVNYKTKSNGQIDLNETNTIVDWSDDTSSYRHATVKFFYNRNHYLLKWRNGNQLETEYTRDVMYGAPLNSVIHDGSAQDGEYRYWFEEPAYFNEDLRDYYTFKGWYYTPYYYRQVDKDTATMPADDMTLYAKWDPKVINVSFYPTYNDYYSGTNRIGDPIPVDYGEYVEIFNIPAHIEDDPDNLRPDLDPPTTGAMFAGWYYIRDNVPVRFDPENIPITALNYEASLSEGARLRLYAEWATTDVGKYRITYVEKDHPENEVADPTIGRSFVWKTRTFNAKGGSELNAEHAWDENSINWWPTTNSHSLLIRSNSQGHHNEYDPNEYAFEYIQKRGVYYRVQYLDAVTRTPLLDPAEIGRDEIYTSVASVKEDAPFIAGYNAEKLSQTMVLTASTAATAEEQKEEELETNVITFYYNLNDRDYIYEVEYWEQNANDNEYTLLESENLQVEIADDPETQEVESTSVRLADIYNGSMSQLILSTGFTRVEGATKVAVTKQDGTTTEIPAADDASVVITGDTKTTIKIYYNRNTYPYQYQYVDYHAERAYLDTPEAQREGMWNGVMETHNGAHEEKVDATITITAPQNLDYNNGTETIPYKRIDNKVITLMIGPTDIDPTTNLVKVYYKKYNVRELEYKLVCNNEDDEFTEVDYDDATGDPLYGGLSMTLQTVNAYNQINPVTFYDFNDAKISDGNGGWEDAHQHRYNFLGWYDNPEGTGNPLVAYDKDNPEKWMTLTKADLGLDEDELPADDVTYYAVVEQVIVHGNFEFRYVEEELPFGGEPIDSTTGETAKDLEAAEIVADAPSDPDGSYTGSYFAFSSPYRYHTGDPLPYHKQEGYTVDILPKENDNLVYKYEFSEWWEEDTNTHKLIRKKGWNQSGEWGAPTSLDKQSDRLEDKHIIAVYVRREVSKLPYVINYNFIDRSGNSQTFVKKGTLTSDQLDETNDNCAVTNHGDYLLTDEFILENAPYESNYGQTLLWSNREGYITKTSQKAGTILEDGSTLSADRVIATITAVQDTKTVYAHYRTTPTGEYTDLSTTYGANYKLDKNMEAITAPETYNGKAFSYWEVRKSSSSSGTVVAKSYDPLFDLCMMDNYWITPVYEAAASGSGTKSAVLDPSAIANGDEQWLAWTWNDDTDGMWVRPDANMRFSGLTDNVIFVRADKTISLSDIAWETTSIWNQTDDLLMIGFNGEDYNGFTFVLTGYSDHKMNGAWSTEPAETPEIAAGDGEASVTLTHLDYTRNHWTDSDGNIAASGETDLLFSDFEIAFEDNGNQIYNSDDYKTGVILEYCATVPTSATFNPTRDYKQATNYDQLKTALTDHLNPDVDDPTWYYYKSSKKRSIVFCDIPTADLTNHNRVEFSRFIYNSYIIEGTEQEPIYTHNQCNYLIKVTAYLVDKDGYVTFSKQPVYICYKNIASQDDALPVMLQNING